MAPFDTVKEPETGEPVYPTRGSSRTENASKHRLWIVALAVLLVAGGWWYLRGRGGLPSTAAVGATGAPAYPGAANGQPTEGVVPVVVATARRGDLPVYFKGLGNVNAFNTVTVRSRVDGQIVKINFTEGQNVKQGDSLIEIDPRPFEVQLEQAEGQLAKDQAQLKDVQIDYERYKQLFQEGVTPRQQVDTQQAQVGQYEGAIKTDQAQINNAKLQLVYSHITAPISGRIGLRLVDMGNIVHATDTNGLLVITQLQPISVIFTLPQDQLPQVMARMHRANAMEVDAYDRDDTQKIASGKLLTIDNQIDSTTGTYKLKAVFENAKGELFPNQFVNVHLLIDTRKQVVLVPATAILRGSQGTYVFSVDRANKVKVKNIVLAETTAGISGISSGLAEGDVVVIDGQDKLQEGSEVDPRTQRVGGGTGQSLSKPDGTGASQAGSAK